MATRLAQFDHQLHLKLGNVAPLIAAAIDKKTYLTSTSPELRAELNTQNPCEACHRGLEVSDRPERSGLPQMADCLVCHNQIDPPYSCEFCHAKGAKLTPASHTPDYLDTHTSGKSGFDKTTCAVCHGRLSYSKKRRPMAAAMRAAASGPTEFSSPYQAFLAFCR